MISPRHRLAILAAALALVAAACTTAVSPSASPTAEPTPTPEPTPSPEPTGDAGLPSEVAIPSFDLDGDPQLAALFPDTVGGQPLEVFSMRGDMFMTAGGSVDPTFQEFLDDVGADLDDVSVAFGASASPEGDEFITVAAFRVVGADEEALLEEFIGASTDEGEIPGGFASRTVSGKEVQVAADPSGVGGEIYIYARNDTVFYIASSNAELADEVLGGLP